MPTTAPVLGFPEKFELALRYGEGPIGEDVELSDSDRLLLNALSQQALVGPCNEPRPSMWDTAANKARWQAWNDLGNRSKMEAMFLYTKAVEELAPDWWKWPPLGFVEEASDSGAPKDEAAPTRPAVPAEPHASAPLQLCPNGQPACGWSRLTDMGGPARYRHAVAVSGAALFVFGGRTSSGRLAPGLHRLDLLSGRWTEAHAGGTPPELRWGHSMSACGRWLLVFGGLRFRSPLDDAAALNTETLSWEALRVGGTRPPARGNHAASVIGSQLWVVGGDAPSCGLLPPVAWALQLRLGADGALEGAWECPATRGAPPPACCDHAAVACGSHVVLLGGSAAGGYLAMGDLPMLDTAALLWSRLRCPGAPPAARAGHVAAVLRGGGGRHSVLVFGGGNSATGLSDVHQLELGPRQLASEGGGPATAAAAAAAAPNGNGAAAAGGKAAWGWRRLQSATAGSAPQPEASEGAALAMSGGVVLVLGGYAATGATKASWAWRMQTPAEAATDAELEQMISALQHEQKRRAAA